jgi:hypothetical protein
MQSELWAGVDRLIDRTPSLEGLRAHGLHLLAMRRWREMGREIPPAARFEELAAVHKAHDALEILRAASDAYDGRLALMKGPEVAAHYPDPACRQISDLDILADDATRAQRALIKAGFEPTGDFGDDYFDGLHHLRPLVLPAHPVLVVEIHRRPNWVDWADPPDVTELLARAVPSSAGASGMLALPREQHAVVVAAHSWGERPLRRISDLLDVAALMDGASRETAGALASAWGISGLWNTTIAAADSLFLGARRPLSMRVWARELEQVRSRTVFEDHIRRWLSTFWVLPPHRALAATAVALARDVTPAPSETWGNKLSRAREALLHPTRSSDEHGRIVGPGGMRPRFKRR